MTPPLQQRESALEPSAPRERSVGELFTELANETSTLVRQEMKLAATEMTRKATYAGKQAAFIGAGSLLAVVSLLALLAALILGLGTMIALWVSALLVGIVVALIAVGLVWKGAMALRQIDVVPKQTLQTIKEDKSWVQQQVR